MDTLERDLSAEISAGIEGPARSRNGNGVSGLALDQLEQEVREVLSLRAQLKERCRSCAALIIEIERAL